MFTLSADAVRPPPRFTMPLTDIHALPSFVSHRNHLPPIAPHSPHSRCLHHPTSSSLLSSAVIQPYQRKAEWHATFDGTTGDADHCQEGWCRPTVVDGRIKFQADSTQYAPRLVCSHSINLWLCLLSLMNVVRECDLHPGVAVNVDLDLFADSRSFHLALPPPLPRRRQRQRHRSKPQVPESRIPPPATRVQAPSPDQYEPPRFRLFSLASASPAHHSRRFPYLQSHLNPTSKLAAMYARSKK